MKFAIINDIHISSGDTGYEKGVQRKLVGHSERLVKDFILEMNQNERPEFVINLGDLIENVGSKEGDTRYLKKALGLFDDLKMPTYFLIGNHDVKTLNHREIAKLFGYNELYYSFDRSGYHFVVLSFQDGLMDEDNQSTPHIPDEQIDWLQADLARSDKPTVVFCHYGLADDDMVGNFWFEEIPHRAIIGNRYQVRKIFETSGRVRAVISAHQHWNRMFVHEGIPYITVTSLVENFNNNGIPAEAYSIVELTDKSIKVEVKGNDPAIFEHLVNH